MLVDLVSYSDNNWAGGPSSRTSQSSGHVDADGCPLVSFSRRQSCVATNRGMAEYYATCARRRRSHCIFRAVLEHFEFRANTTLFETQWQHVGSFNVLEWKGQSIDGEDAMAARNGSKSWAADQGGILESEQSGFGRKFYLWPNTTLCKLRAGSWSLESQRVNLSTRVEQMAEQ